MGVPALFRWLSQKYPKIISPVIEEQPIEVQGEMIPVDATKPNPNNEEFDNLYLDMNGIVHPCSHPEDRPPPANEAEMMAAIFEYTDRVFNMVRPRKLLMIAIDGVAPRAKMNQQRSRRFRSAKEAKEKDEDQLEFLKLLKKQNGGDISEAALATLQTKTWDSNQITPGTPFMNLLAASLRYWCAYKVNEDPAWENVKVIISDATVPGEGEHKIMEFLRSQRSSQSHDPNTRHVLYGLDADLIMLGLASHEPHFRVLREDVFFQESKGRTCRICGQSGHIAENCKGGAKKKEGEFDEKDKAAALKPFIWLHVSVLREYLEAELYVPRQPFPFDLERALDDWVFMCFFVGNDFLPHLPSLSIRDNGIDTLIAIWRDNIENMGGYVTKDGQINLGRAQFILDGLAKQEDSIFQRQHQTEERKEANAKRRKLEEQNRNGNHQSNGADKIGSDGRRKSPDYSTPTNNRKVKNDPTQPVPGEQMFMPSETNRNRAMTHDMIMNRSAVETTNMANKSAAAALKSKLLGKQSHPLPHQGEADSDTIRQDGDTETQTPPTALGKRKAEFMEADSGLDTQETTPKAIAKSDDPPPDDIRLWESGYSDRYYSAKWGVDPLDIAFRNKVARDYVEGLAWVLQYYLQGCQSWNYFYPHHYAPFGADFKDMDQIEINFAKGTPFRPYEQLMAVLPAASKTALPAVFWPLMTEEDSEIIDFYPEDFQIDLNGKKFAWQGVALLPFIDEKRLLDAIAKKYPLLSAEDAARNGVGKDVLIFSEKSDLGKDIATVFYSKRQGAPEYSLNTRISKGLIGTVQKNDDYLPQSSLTSPLDGLPELDEDRSMSVHFTMPRSSQIHKSMLLRGVELPPAVLTRADIEATKGRAAHSGRSHGGAPLRGNGRGRGGQISYADDRPNPFAAHLNPGYAPHNLPGNGRGGPPPPLPVGRGPPPSPDMYFRGQPPVPPPYAAPYNSQNGNYGPPPPQYNYGPPPPNNGYHYPPLRPQGNYQNGGQNPYPGNNGYGRGQDNRYGNQGGWGGR